MSEANKPTILPSQEYLQECFNYDPNTGKLKFQADFSDPLSKLTFVYDKNKDDFKKLYFQVMKA